MADAHATVARIFSRSRSSKEEIEFQLRKPLHLKEQDMQQDRAELQYFRPHDGFGKGCPMPACQPERQETAVGIHKQMTLRDGELESTLRAICKVFDVSTATVSLLTGERIYLAAACGALPVCVCPDRWGFCGWSFLNANHELNVVENMLEDARFSENFFVVSETFKLVFYVMAPLISANGHRIGTLCIMGQEPRKFDATRGAILANLSELLVRQIEARWALQEENKQQGSNLLRSADAYTSACSLVDASDNNNWRILHLNAPAVELLGTKWDVGYDQLANFDERRQMESFEGVKLKSLFDIDLGMAAWQAAQVELVVSNVKGAKGTPAVGKRFTITFRLAASGVLDEYAPFSVGVPSWLRESKDITPRNNYFFMHIKPADAAAPQKGPLVKESKLQFGPRLLGACPIPGLVLGPLLGKGGFGRVFRGVLNGTEVAVKIIDKLNSVQMNSEGVPVEFALTQGLYHLGVLRSTAWAIGQPDPQLARLSNTVQPTCWMLFDYCDKGTLHDAVVKGWFRTSRLPTQGGTHLRTVAVTAYELAGAMAYIHSQGLCHLDLTGGNVLLTTCANNPHGFSAKVTDFGLARSKDLTTRTTPGSYGTITHMAPETIKEGLLGPACDVYAWGVLLWEMITGSRAWAGMTHEAVQAAVVGSQQLEVPAQLPANLQELLVASLSKIPEHRLTFKDMLPKLEEYLQTTRGCSVAELELPLRSMAPRE